MLSERFEMRYTVDLLRKIDEWRRSQPDLPPRAEAIRRLLDQALATEAQAAPAKRKARG